MSHKIYAVIGDPVAHSRSPAMHNAAFRALNLDAEYIAVRVAEAELGAFAADARKKLAGFNVTVPHKHAILAFLDEIESSAALAGSVNTVAVRDGRLVGCSTDGYGLETALREAFGWTVSGHGLLLIGCGGVARAAAFHFAQHSLRQLFILNRTVVKAEALAAELQDHFPGLATESGALADPAKVKEFLNAVPVAVQCTSLGLKESDPPPFPAELLPRTIGLFDMVYRSTPLLKYAAEHGIARASGLGMLLHQGARSFAVWTGREPPLQAMRAALPDLPGI